VAGVDHSVELAALVGQPSGPAVIGRDTVDRNMIRHFTEATGDENPVYHSDEAAKAVGLDGVIAPPAMLQTWIMAGLRATLAREEARRAGGPAGQTAMDKVNALVDDEGLTSVVATNCEQEYHRYLVPGERLVVRSTIESISDRKATALGDGRFVTTRLTFVAVPAEIAEEADATTLMAAGVPVAEMVFRILRFAPKVVGAPAGDGGATRPRRPRPPLTEDNRFFFEGAREGKLLIQRCTSCGRLRHPPLPACANCQSLEWDTVEASGKGELYSYVVVHHPQVPAFDYPLVIGLVALEEGTRLVAGLDGVDPADVRIGMPVEASIVTFDDELSLPVFHPAGEAG